MTEGEKIKKQKPKNKKQGDPCIVEWFVVQASARNRLIQPVGFVEAWNPAQSGSSVKKLTEASSDSGRRRRREEDLHTLVGRIMLLYI